MATRVPIPITVFTGFLGAGKTSIILSLLPQLPKDYRVVLLKNEFGDVEVDSQLAKQSSLAAVSEILNGCMCCVLVGQMKTALLEIREQYRPDRIIIECSGSAFPATLAFQIRELERETEGDLKLDAIVTVIDAENFTEYEDTSPTARMQASYTDVLLINKWEHVSERALDILIDHLATLNDLTPKIKCKGREGVDPNFIFGLDSRLFRLEDDRTTTADGYHHEEVETATVYRGTAPAHRDGHGTECECSDSDVVDAHGGGVVEASVLAEALAGLSKDTTWRVKGFVRFADGERILNWAFGRYSLTDAPTGTLRSSDGVRLTVMGERGEVRRAARRLADKLGAQMMVYLMFSYVLSSASTYFRLPIDEDQFDDEDDNVFSSTRHITWNPSGSNSSDSDDSDAPFSSSSRSSSPSTNFASNSNKAVIREILSQDDLYRILGIQRAPCIDRLTLRRAYLFRSKACHPDKFPDSPEATRAFQKVSVAYDVLSKPSSKRLYDSRPPQSPYDLFASRPYPAPEETFRSVVLGVFNDILDGDLDMIRTLLRAVNDINPSLRLGEDGINSVLLTLHSIRERALTCRTCILALHSELTNLLEVQRTFRSLSYLDLRRRSCLTVRLARLTVRLPIALEQAIRQQRGLDVYGPPAAGVGRGRDGVGVGTGSNRIRNYAEAASVDNAERTELLNARVYTLLCGLVHVLERMERILK
ncbi:uncharacterized protein FIBRA_09376 [Fibroporia radiculosa]|uniref:J domain-containing protein n=1 Tax=Fibroporia radiculosa TaxID=599839 RepID=J7S6D8_9APHY|nr:uncharacterized protein FIBRA_09376 [Fibroporia radiculosa]CCM07054.1 predicted protein [Fibroporia radiculosa]